MRITGIPVGIIGRVHEVIVTQAIDGVARWSLIRLDRSDALTFEIGAGGHRQITHVEVALELVNFIESPEQPWEPRTIGLKKRDFEFCMPFENTRAEKTSHCKHLSNQLAVRPL